MKRYSIIILLIFSSNLFAQTNHKSILYLRSESKQLIENSYLSSDSINSKRILNQKHSAGNILLQSLSGSVLGLGAGVLVTAGAISNSISHSEENNTGSAIAYILLLPTSIIFATATGVHLVAKFENPEHSFWETVKYSGYGVGGGIVASIIFASTSKKISRGGLIFIGLTPLVGSLIYSNFVADWPDKNNNLKEVSFRNMNYSFKDYYDSKQIFRINILSLSF